MLQNKSKTAEIRVPAWPIPTHQTKFVISQAQPTVLFSPQVPIPVPIVYAIQPKPHRKATIAIEKAIHQSRSGGVSTGLAISLEISA